MSTNNKIDQGSHEATRLHYERMAMLAECDEAKKLQAEIVSLLGEHAGRLFLHEGKIFDIRFYGGAYVWGLTHEEREGGRELIRGLLKKLAAGERVPVMLMYKYRSGMPLADFPELQLDAGVLFRVFPDGRKEQV